MNQPASSAPPTAQPPTFANQQQLNQAVALVNLQRRVKSGASNFYFIAGLSVVNSLISAFNGGLTFVIGLAITQLVDGFALGISQTAPDIAMIVKVVGLALSIVISGIVAIFGYFAGKGHRWAFLTGMILYGLDALIMLAFGDWLAFAFHLFFLWGLFAGLQALNKLQKLAPAPAISDFPRDIGVS